MDARIARNPIVLAAVVAVVFALGQLGLAIRGGPGATAAIWPPSGFAFVAVLLLGRSIWPAIFAGAVLVSLTSTGHVASAVMVATGSTLEAVAGAALVRRLAGGLHAFRHASTVFRFVAIVALVAAPLSATMGALAGTMTSTVGFGDLAYVWMSRWLANLTALVVIAPFFMLWLPEGLKPSPESAEPARSWERNRWLVAVESVVLLALLVAVGLVVFDGRFPSDEKSYPLEVLCVPFLLWAAFRLGRRTVATAVLFLCAMATWGTLHAYGPFVHDSLFEALVLVQVYVCVIAVTGSALAAVVADYQDAQAQLRELATTDPLTGLVNYRRLLEVLRAEIARSGRTDRPFAVLFLDMNGLKAINDRHGHLAGSRALCRLADVLRQSCRTTDTAARFGGDEFAVVLPETDDNGARVVLDRVHDRLAESTDKPPVSVSGGVALFPRDGATPTLLMRSADAALYRAKAEVAAARKKPAARLVAGQDRVARLF